MKKSIVTPRVETEGLEHKVRSSSQEAGEAPECACSRDKYPSCPSVEGIFLFWNERQSLQVEIVIFIIINFPHRTV